MLRLNPTPTIGGGIIDKHEFARQNLKDILAGGALNIQKGTTQINHRMPGNPRENLLTVAGVNR